MEQVGSIDNIIECSNISKEFTNERGVFKVIEKLDFKVKKNEFLVLFGPGQCGKTTALNVLSGLETPSAGEIRLKGKKITSPGPDRGFVYQTTALFPWLNVMGNVSFGPRVRGQKKRVWMERAEKYIKLVGLEDYRTYYPGELSASMLQRVVIARAFATEPELLLMDEPYGQLDYELRFHLEDELVKLWKQTKTTVIFITHNIEEAVYLGERIMVLTNKPTKVKDNIMCDLKRPRNIAAPEFVELRNKVTELIKWW